MPVWATIALGLGGSIVGGIVARILIGTAGGFLFLAMWCSLLLKSSPRCRQASKE